MTKDKKQSMRQEKIAKWRKFARKRWVYPAVYLGLAAIIIAAVLWLQLDHQDNHALDNQKSKENQTVYNHNKNQKAVPVNKMNEEFAWPVKDRNAVFVQKKFFDFNASEKEKEAALVLNDHTYRPNTGINLATESGESFAVTAAMSGTVVRAEQDPNLGYVVEVDNGNGVTTLYESLQGTKVEKGDQVKQGQKLGMAGKSDYFKNEGNILHFEIRKDGTPVNPVSYFGQHKSDLPKTKDHSDQSDMNRGQDQGTPGQDQKAPDQNKGTSGQQDKKTPDQDQKTGGQKDTDTQLNNTSSSKDA